RESGSGRWNRRSREGIGSWETHPSKHRMTLADPRAAAPVAVAPLASAAEGRPPEAARLESKIGRARSSPCAAQRPWRTLILSCRSHKMGALDHLPFRFVVGPRFFRQVTVSKEELQL